LLFVGQVRIASTRILFSTTMMISCSMFLLMAFEIASILQPSTRWLLWKTDIISMLVLLVFALPLKIVYNLSGVVSKRLQMRLPICACLFLGFLYCFYKVGIFDLKAYR